MRKPGGNSKRSAKSTGLSAADAAIPRNNASARNQKNPCSGRAVQAGRAPSRRAAGGGADHGLDEFRVSNVTPAPATAERSRSESFGGRKKCLGIAEQKPGRLDRGMARWV